MSFDPYPRPRPAPSPTPPPPPYPPDPSPRPVPAQVTYPWQPDPPAAPERPRGRRHAALGHHSDLRVLRSAYRWQRRTATLAALGYFTLFLILSAYAPSFMSRTVVDGLPTGVLLALAQLPVTWLAIALYEHTARRYVDPLADRIRRQTALDAKREENR
ncbi:DUF485 domain-containing protein [Streptomyces sp. NPDC005925]|uniref:DUF485 domain-containing protein n=1 Tax=Streptomyces sp. NPDC005925 TaxID=3157172 RepID=UPI0033CCC384